LRGFHYHFNLKSHDPGRIIPEHVEIVRHEWEEGRHLVLRLLAFVVAFEEGMEINGRPLSDDAPYQPAFGKWDLEKRPLIWGECEPGDYKRIKKISTKASGCQIMLSTSSEPIAVESLAALKRQKLRPGRYRILFFDPEMVQEMMDHLDRRNTFTLVQASLEPPSFQFDFNGLWFDTTFGEMNY
jgi:uncharacterized protein YaeQ